MAVGARAPCQRQPGERRLVALKSFTYDTNEVETRPRLRSGYRRSGHDDTGGGRGAGWQARAHTVTTTVDVGNMPAAVAVSPGTNDNQ